MIISRLNTQTVTILSLKSAEVLCLMEANLIVGFEKYLLSQTKRDSQNYQLWLLLKRVARARSKTDVPAPTNAELARKLKISSSLLRNRLSDLLAFYQEYLAVLHLRATPSLNASLALVRAVGTGNEPFIRWAEKKAERQILDSINYDTNAIYDSLRFNRILHEWHTEKINQVNAEKMSGLDQQLDQFTLVEKCKLYIDAINIKSGGDPVLEKLAVDITSLREGRRESAGDDELSFAENIYYHLYLIAREKNEDSFQFVFQRVEEIFKRFPSRDAKFVLAILTNRFARQIVSGDDSNEKDYFRVIKALIGSPKVQVNEWMLKNFVTVLCRLKEVDFALEVLNTYLPQLPDDRRQLSSYYNRAIIKMARGELTEATELLGMITLSESAYYVGGRFILFRAMYEAKDHDGLLSLMKSFKGYITRLKTMNATFKESAFRFINYLSELVRLVSNRRFTDPLVFEKRVTQLLGRVSENNAVVSREWLLHEIRAQL